MRRKGDEQKQTSLQNGCCNSQDWGETGKECVHRYSLVVGHNVLHRTAWTILSRPRPFTRVTRNVSKVSNPTFQWFVIKLAFLFLVQFDALFWNHREKATRSRHGRKRIPCLSHSRLSHGRCPSLCGRRLFPFLDHSCPASDVRHRGRGMRDRRRDRRHTPCPSRFPLGRTRCPYPDRGRFPFLVRSCREGGDQACAARRHRRSRTKSRRMPPILSKAGRDHRRSHAPRGRGRVPCPSRCCAP